VLLHWFSYRIRCTNITYDKFGLSACQ
jgi:hypothetical protein